MTTHDTLDADNDTTGTPINFPIDLIRQTAVRPTGCPDHYVLGWKAVRPDLTTRNGFRWYPNTVVRSDHNLKEHDNPCPEQEGDVLCLALTLRGAGSGGFPSLTLVACWYDPDRVAAATIDNLRVAGEIYTGDVFDTAALIRNNNLTGANLPWANLHGANLPGANLPGANLRWANLTRVDLPWANLRWADLTGANLPGANLPWADLTGANLTRVDLTGANLPGADLRGADLGGANLGGADLPVSLSAREAKKRGAVL